MSTTTNLLITKMEQAQAQKEVTFNAALDLLDKAIATVLSKSVAGGSDVTLTAAEAANAVLHLTGVLTGNINVIVPVTHKLWVISNATTGSFTLTVKTSAGTGIAVTQGTRVWLYCDGTNVVQTTVASGAGLPIDTLGAASDITTLNASSTAHGLLPKLSNVSTEYLNGTGAFSTPAGGGGAGAAVALINGNFDIWQRGTSFVAIANADYSADRWYYAKSSTAVHTVSRDTSVPTVAQSSMLSNYSLLATLTTADTVIGTNQYCVLHHRIEGYNFKNLAQRAMTLSFWVKATLTGTYCVSVRNSGLDRSYVAEYTISVTDTWEKKTINILASPSAGTWDYTNGIGLDLGFVLACGTDAHTTAGAWQTGNYLATVNQVNGVDTGSTSFRLAQVQLETGSTATAFATRSFLDELQLCQRYFWKTFLQATTPASSAGSGTGELAWITTRAGAVIQFSGFFQHPVLMRAQPTAVFYNPIVAGAHVNDVSIGSGTCNNTIFLWPTERGFLVQCTTIAGTAIGDILVVHMTVSAEFA